MTDDPLLSRISQFVTKLPEWLRHDLAAQDKKARERAEETLTAMLIATIQPTDD